MDNNRRSLRAKQPSKKYILNHNDFVNQNNTILLNSTPIANSENTIPIASVNQSSGPLNFEEKSEERRNFENYLAAENNTSYSDDVASNSEYEYTYDEEQDLEVHEGLEKLDGNSQNVFEGYVPEYTKNIKSDYDETKFKTSFKLENRKINFKEENSDSQEELDYYKSSDDDIPNDLIYEEEEVEEDFKETVIPDLHIPETSRDLVITQHLVNSQNFDNLENSLTITSPLFMKTISIYEVLRRFRSIIKLSPFRYETFCAALCSDEQNNVLLYEIFLSLIKILLKEDDIKSSWYGPYDLKDSINIMLQSLDSLTWPEIVVLYITCIKKHENKKFDNIDSNFLNSIENKLHALGFLCDLILSSSTVRLDITNEGLIKHDENCRACQKQGQLICCDTCSAVFHLTCTSPPLAQVPEYDWICNICKANQVAGVSDCVSAIEKNGLLIRQDPLGIDRHKRKYWFLCRRIIVESENQIWYYTTKGKINLLLKVLDGEKYEKNLVKKLQENIESIEAGMEITQRITNIVKGQYSKTLIEIENEYCTILEDFITQNIKSNQSGQSITTPNQDDDNLLQLANLASNISGDSSHPKFTSFYDYIFKTYGVTVDHFFSLGQELGYKVYTNQYTANPLAISKQFNDEKDKKRYLANKFPSFQHFGTNLDFKWASSTFGSPSLTILLLRNAIISVENRISPAFMHGSWKIYKDKWAKAIQMLMQPKDFAFALSIFECAIRPIVFTNVWNEGLGHTHLSLFTQLDREESKKLKNAPTAKETEEDVESARWIKYSKFPRGLIHSVWKAKGEEYRLYGGGWYWVSRTRQNIIQKPIQRKLMNPLNALNTTFNGLIDVSQGLENKLSSYPPLYNDFVRPTKLDEEERLFLIDSMLELRGETITNQAQHLHSELQDMVKHATESGYQVSTPFENNYSMANMKQLSTLEWKLVPLNTKTLNLSENAIEEPSNSSEQRSESKTSELINLETDLAVLRDKVRRLFDTSAIAHLLDAQFPVAILKLSPSFSNNSLLSITRIKLGKRQPKIKKIFNKMVVPLGSKFLTKRTKRFSIFVLADHELKRLARFLNHFYHTSLGLYEDASRVTVLVKNPKYFEVQGFAHNAKSNQQFWPYYSPRPLFKTAWRYRTWTADSLYAIALQLKILYYAIQWDEMNVKPPLAGVHTITTDEEITTIDILKRTEPIYAGQEARYLVRKIVMPLSLAMNAQQNSATPKQEGNNNGEPVVKKEMTEKELLLNQFDPDYFLPQRTSQRVKKSLEPEKGVLKSSVTEYWVTERQLSLWQIQLFADKLEKKVQAQERAKLAIQSNANINFNVASVQNNSVMMGTPNSDENKIVFNPNVIGLVNPKTGAIEQTSATNLGNYLLTQQNNPLGSVNTLPLAGIRLPNSINNYPTSHFSRIVSQGMPNTNLPQLPLNFINQTSSLSPLKLHQIQSIAFSSSNAMTAGGSNLGVINNLAGSASLPNNPTLQSFSNNNNPLNVQIKNFSPGHQIIRLPDGRLQLINLPPNLLASLSQQQNFKVHSNTTVNVQPAFINSSMAAPQHALNHIAAASEIKTVRTDDNKKFEITPQITQKILRQAILNSTDPSEQHKLLALQKAAHPPQENLNRSLLDGTRDRSNLNRSPLSRASTYGNNNTQYGSSYNNNQSNIGNNRRFAELCIDPAKLSINLTIALAKARNTSYYIRNSPYATPQERETNQRFTGVCQTVKHILDTIDKTERRLYKESTKYQSDQLDAMLNKHKLLLKNVIMKKRAKLEVKLNLAIQRKQFLMLYPGIPIPTYLLDSVEDFIAAGRKKRGPYKKKNKGSISSSSKRRKGDRYDEDLTDESDEEEEDFEEDEDEFADNEEFYVNGGAGEVCEDDEDVKNEGLLFSLHKSSNKTSSTTPAASATVNAHLKDPSNPNAASSVGEKSTLNRSRSNKKSSGDSGSKPKSTEDSLPNSWSKGVANNTGSSSSKSLRGKISMFGARRKPKVLTTADDKQTTSNRRGRNKPNEQEAIASSEITEIGNGPVENSNAEGNLSFSDGEGRSSDNISNHDGEDNLDSNLFDQSDINDDDDDGNDGSTPLYTKHQNLMARVQKAISASKRKRITLNNKDDDGPGGAEPGNELDGAGEKRTVFCVCKTPYDKTRFYIGCDKCTNWFHGECVNITPREAKLMESYVCLECKAKAAAAASRKTAALAAPPGSAVKKRKMGSGGGRKPGSKQELYCICKQPYDESQFYIGCDHCQDWFHGKCVGILPSEASEIEEYICPNCQATSGPSLNNTALTANLKTLDESDYESVYRLLKQLKGHPKSWPFLEPVDAKDAPDYYKVIKEPMDLKKVEKKIIKRQYRKLKDFIGDLTKIFDNCRYYNARDSTYWQCAEVLETFFLQKLKNLRKQTSDTIIGLTPTPNLQPTPSTFHAPSISPMNHSHGYTSNSLNNSSFMDNSF